MFFLTKSLLFHIIKKPSEQSDSKTGRQYPELAPAEHKGRQVMDMDVYQTTMVCLAAMTLLLKLIEFILNQIKK